jgi:hypothetical protein
MGGHLDLTDENAFEVAAENELRCRNCKRYPIGCFFSRQFRRMHSVGE